MLLWNTVAMSVQRYLRSSSWSIVVMSVPSNRIVPPAIRPGRCSSRSRAMPRVVLPDPDSPISPTNSPGSIANVTLLTASTGACRLGSYRICRSCTSSSGMP